MEYKKEALTRTVLIEKTIVFMIRIETHLDNLTKWWYRNSIGSYFSVRCITKKDNLYYYATEESHTKLYVVVGNNGTMNNGYLIKKSDCKKVYLK